MYTPKPSANSLINETGLIKHDEDNPGKPACLLRDSAPLAGRVLLLKSLQDLFYPGGIFSDVANTHAGYRAHINS